MMIVEQARQAVSDMLKVDVTPTSHLGGDLPLVHWLPTGENVTVKVMWLGQTFMTSFPVDENFVTEVTEWIESIKNGEQK